MSRRGANSAGQPPVCLVCEGGRVLARASTAVVLLLVQEVRVAWQGEAGAGVKGQGWGRLLGLDLADLCGQSLEGLLHVGVGLGTGLDELHVVEVSVLLQGWTDGRTSGTDKQTTCFPQNAHLLVPP